MQMNEIVQIIADLLCAVCRYSEEEISRKVTVYRQMLIDNLETTASSSSRAVETDEAGRPMYAASAAFLCFVHIFVNSD